MRRNEMKLLLVRQIIEQESWATAKMTARCALLWVSRKFLRAPEYAYPRLLFPKFLMGFCSDRSYKCAYKIWSSYSFTHSWDNRGYSKIWTVSGYAHAPFSPKFLWAFVPMDPVNVLAKFEVHIYSFTSSWDNSDWSFGWWLRSPNLREEDDVGGLGWYCSKERWWVRI